MEVIVTETGHIHDLCIFTNNGIDCVQDLLGNNDAFGNDELQFHENSDGTWSARQETIDWWEAYINDLKAIEVETETLRDLLERNGLDPFLAEAVGQAVAAESDLEMHRHVAAMKIADILHENGLAV